MQPWYIHDVIEMVGSSSIIDRKYVQRQSAGPEDAPDFCDRDAGIFDVFQHVIAEDNVERLVRVGDLPVTANFELDVQTAAFRILSRKLNHILEWFNAADALCAAQLVFDSPTS